MIKDNDLKLIIDQLMNNDEATDKELIEFLTDETSLKEDEVKKIVSKLRKDFSSTAYMRKSEKELGKIINDLDISESLCEKLNKAIKG